MNDKILISYSDHFSKDDFSELKKDDLFEFNRFRQKSFDIPLILTIGFTNAAIWFSKGFFTRLGENLADNISKPYKNLKKNVSAKLFAKSSNPVCCISIFDENGLEIRIYFKPNNEKDLESNFDDVKKIYEKMTCVLENKKEELKRITITIVGDEVTNFFYITKDDQLFVSN